MLGDRPHWRFIALAVLVVSVATISAQTPGPQPLDLSRPVGYFIDTGDPRDAYQPADRDLARWALEAWQAVIGPALRLRPVAEPAARVRVYWAGPQGGQYGEMRSLMVAGQTGAAVFVRPDMNALGPDVAMMAARDPLLRDTVVYLTCVHKLGHAFGLQHTADYRDIMYSFQFGGDIVEYFSRFRRRLKTRDDILRTSAMSDADLVRARTLYPQ